MASQGVGSNLAGATVSIGGSAALIVAARATRKSLIVQNVHASQLLYLGGSAVAVADGLRVAAAGGTQTFNDFNGPLYGIASGAATDVRVLEVY